MLKVPRKISILLAALSVSASFSGCNGERLTFVAQQGEMLGTSYHIKAELAPRRVREIGRRVEQLDTQMKGEMSIFDPNSLISRINRNETDSLTPWLERNIRLADSISRLSGGRYDITVAPLVEAWGFGRGVRVSTPNIDSLLEFVGYEGIRVEQGRIVKRDGRMQIDLNSIAKGFTVDRIADILDDLGSQNYMVEVGGEMRLRGHNPRGGGWRVGVESPFDGNMSDGEFIERRVMVADTSRLRAIATSGNYRRFYLSEDGQKVTHTIDPLTGRSRTSSLLSATVLAPSCAEADAYATMLMAVGGEEASELAEQIENCEVYLIYNGETEQHYREYISQGMKRRMMD